MTAPAPTTTVQFSVNRQGWTLFSMRIWVDDVEQTVTLDAPNGRGWAVWNSSEETNPSEHHTYAIAHVRAPWMQEKNIDSRAALPLGDGGPGCFFIQDIHVASLEFRPGLTLRRCAEEDDDDGRIPLPQYTWSANGTSLYRYACAYVRGSLPHIRLTIGSDVDGDARMGVGVVITPSPYWGESVPNLFTVSPPAKFGGSQVELEAQNPLADYVNIYGLSISVQLYLVPTCTTDSYLPVGTPRTSSGTLYATLAAPQPPMAEPWEAVLSYACTWAALTTTATDAATRLTEGTYNNCTYNNGWFAHTDRDTATDDSEDFYLLDFLNGTERQRAGALEGQCNDFADFLVCLSNALGAEPLKAQRSALWVDILDGIDDITWCHFWTWPITLCHNPGPPNGPPAESLRWVYHQWSNGGTVYDGCIRFGGTTTPANMGFTSYINSLRNPVDSIRWNPQPPINDLNILNHRPQP